MASIQQELRRAEKADLIIAHGLRPSMYLRNGYQLDPRELPCPFKPKDRKINYFAKVLNPKLTLSKWRNERPKSIELGSDSLRAYYAEYQPKRRPPPPAVISTRRTRRTAENEAAKSKKRQRKRRR